MYSVAKDEHTATTFDVYQALAYAVRDRLMERWFRTQSAYYLGRRQARLLPLARVPAWAARCIHNVINLGARDAYIDAACGSCGYDLEALQEQRVGRRAWATAAWAGWPPASWTPRPRWHLPFYGYGIRYEYGIFQQRIQDGFQVESPGQLAALRQPVGDPAPRRHLPRALLRPRRALHRRGGRASACAGSDAEDVWAMAYDTPGGRLRQRHRQHAAALGGRSRAASSTCRASTPANTCARSRTRRAARTSPRSSTRRTTSTRARSCASSSSTSSSPRRCRTCCAGS